MVTRPLTGLEHNLVLLSMSGLTRVVPLAVTRAWLKQFTGSAGRPEAQMPDPTLLYP